MPRPFHVLQVATIMNRGGLETMLMNYYRQLRQGGSPTAILGRCANVFYSQLIL